MSAIITGKVFWTDYSGVFFINQKGRKINVKESTAKAVMLAIGDSADDFGENSWQSFETIAQKASIERPTACRVVRALIEHGHLKVAGRTRYGTNNFTVILDKLGEPPKSRAKTGRPKKDDFDLLESGNPEPESSDPENESSNPETKSSNPESESGNPETESGNPGHHDPSINHPEPFLKKGASAKTKKAILSNPGWAIAAGEPYEPDETQVALEDIRDRWENRMHYSPPWDLPGWESFPAWLLEKQAQGQSIQTFARWFQSDKFRKSGIGMWTPNGDKQGRFSFKSVWPQAFVSATKGETPSRKRELTPFERATQDIEAF